MLLKTRSILAQAAILTLITLAKSQNYDSEYHGSDDESEDSGYTDEGPQRQDYTKYFGSPESGAQIQGGTASGFVTPIQFASFFGSPEFAFGDSNNQPVIKPLIAAETKQDDGNGFVNPNDFKIGFAEHTTGGFGAGQDFFEQAQKQKTEDEENVESKPGPSYISHRVPPKKGYKAEVEDLRQKPSKYQSVRNKNIEAEDLEEIDEKDEEQQQNYDLPEYTEAFKPSPTLDLAQFQPTNPTKILDVVTNLNNLQVNPEYYKKYANTVAQVTPYQKYSFQPAPAASNNFGLKEAALLNAFQSTAAPFNPSYSNVAATAATNYEFQPSEIVSQNIKNKDCIKVNKEVSHQSGKFNKQPMNCYVCKDSKSGAKYEQCSYSSEPTPKSYYQSTSQSYGKRNPDSYRNKRDESESYSDPYEEIKAKSHDYYSKPDEFEKEYYKSPDFSKLSEEYSYNPETFHAKEAEEKSYSEIQSEELVKKGDNCKKSHKNGVTCMVCTNPKTGANYEQCSYESAPKEKKYAYVRESKYDGDGNPIEEKVVDSTDPKPVVSKDSGKFGKISRSDDVENIEPEQPEESKRSESQESDLPRITKLIDDSPYDVPSHFAEKTAKIQDAGVRGLDPELYGNSDSSEKAEEEDESERGPQKFTNLDEYHLKLFPQFADEETKREETRTKPDNPYFEDLDGKKDVEKVLEEFAKKDRSNCKQIHKKGMTCYLCVDKKGIQQEECMYVSESRPQSSHVAYHEVQHIKKPEKPNVSESESKINPVEVLAEESQKRKKFFKKATSSDVQDSEANASTNVETRIKFTPEAAASTNTFKKLPKNKRNTNSKDNKRSKNAEAEEEEPKPQFDVNDEGGLYSAETKPVYSKALGLTLPRYMLEKSHLETEFDRSVDSYN